MAFNKKATSSSFLQDYEILEENRFFDTFVQYIVLDKRKLDTRAILTRETVEKSPENMTRMDALIKAKDNNLVLADEIYINQVNSLALVYTVMPFLTDSQSSLRSLLNADVLTSSQKARIFQNLSSLIASLHELGVPHLELSPDSVYVENESTVYLKPYRIVPDIYIEESYYCSPEVLSGIPYYLQQFTSDCWSLGCIYAELFISLAPLFQAPSAQEKILKMFEVLGTPNFQEVEEYLTWENYLELKTLAKQSKEPIKHMIFSSVSGKEKDLVLGMLSFALSFAIDKRPEIKNVADFLYDEDEISQIKDFEEIPLQFEILEKKTTSAHSSFRITKEKEQSLLLESEPKKVIFKMPDAITDNVLYINLISAINMELFRYCTDEYFLIFSFDLDISNKAQKFTTGLIKAGLSAQINFNKEIPINTVDFKNKYRTNPLILQINLCLVNGNRRREDPLGVCEAYLGLLFSSQVLGNSESVVHGWYHMTSGQGVIGQLQLEIRSKLPFRQVENYKKSSLSSENLHGPDTQKSDISLIKGISQDLCNLTAQLREKTEFKQKQEEEDMNFNETLKQLKKLLLDKP
ncbi:hypothetical protein SteCoe_27904 [Stentor coeruleus]|uniref:Protein kinase domain-containing protein n=1 Tax=Stentor coeruleus TaxID=5963 RepID=A0A1R2B9H5_9CILI|nr:hypothetical protein SteCoe_27904 [Stentor coeruleus]